MQMICIYKKMTAQDLYKHLKEKGFRLTKGRKAIISLFLKRHCSLSSQDIYDALHQDGIRVNLSTVYRELQFLLEQRILKSIFFHDGIQRYELLEEDHHHHLVCTNCNATTRFHIDHDLKTLEKTLESDHGFTITDHNLEFFGTCQKCL